MSRSTPVSFRRSHSGLDMKLAPTKQLVAKYSLGNLGSRFRSSPACVDLYSESSSVST